jgi:hypothetical protein
MQDGGHNDVDYLDRWIIQHGAIIAVGLGNTIPGGKVSYAVVQGRYRSNIRRDSM